MSMTSIPSPPLGPLPEDANGGSTVSGPVHSGLPSSDRSLGDKFPVDQSPSDQSPGDKSLGDKSLGDKSQSGGLSDVPGMSMYELRHYWSYMPVRTLRERTISWIGSLVGAGWPETLWLDKYSGLHECRRRFGDRQVVELYRRDKTWIELPIPCFLLMTRLDRFSLDEACWTWIREQREAMAGWLETHDGVPESASTGEEKRSPARKKEIVVPRPVIRARVDDVLGI